MQKIVIVTGPTCSGKTAYSLELAQRIGAEIISCDSVQIYRGMDIGSAKASPQERARIRHHLIDVVNPTELFDVSKYALLAKAALEEIQARGKNVVVVGGSGFYLKAWFGAVADNVEITPTAKEFADKVEQSGTDALAEELLKVDVDAAKFLDMRNPRRTKNALMRCLSSGLSIAQLRENFSKMKSPIGDFEREVVFLNPEKSKLAPLVAKRTRAMLERGLVEEVRMLLAKFGKLNSSAASAIGYRETIEFINSDLQDLSALCASIEQNTLRLVKKQKIFFKTQLNLLNSND